jgi:hypothetical protein
MPFGERRFAACEEGIFVHFGVNDAGDGFAGADFCHGASKVFQS